jgi:hypothetical protein
MTVAKANGGDFKGIVAYESRGYVFAESTNIRLGKNTRYRVLIRINARIVRY